MNDSFQFSFSPVQSFVSQARRTRDLWAGSYLLSYLSGQAMLAVEKAGGKVVFPDVTSDALLAAIRGQAAVTGTDHLIGSLPNRFTGRGDNPAALARTAADALVGSWRRLGQAVWTELAALPSFSAPFLGEVQRTLWERQIGSIWEIMWVVGDDGAVMERRKLCRLSPLASEPGERCTLCGEREVLSWGKDATWQEIREYWRVLARAVEERWGGKEIAADGSERLCAICTIKRIYPLIGQTALGWPVPRSYISYASTPYLAASDWLGKIENKREEPLLAHALHKVVEAAKAARAVSEHKDHASDSWNVFCHLDGNLYFSSGLAAWLQEHQDASSLALRDAITELRKNLAHLGLQSEPTPYYAVLLMDGDNMGALLARNKGAEANISRALARFSREVPALIRYHKGEAIYAGGDDVLALLPMDQALTCADQIRRSYLAVFAESLPGQKVSISAAVTYAHRRSPLRVVVRETHRLLDEVAKEQNGRDSFVLGIWRRNGPGPVVVRPWVDDASFRDWVIEIGQVVQAIAERQCSSKYLYQLSDLFEIIEPAHGEQRMEASLAYRLALAEFLDNREHELAGRNKAEVRALAEGIVGRLVAFAREARWQIEQEERKLCIGSVQGDALKLARFLAHQEVRG